MKPKGPPVCKIKLMRTTLNEHHIYLTIIKLFALSFNKTKGNEKYDKKT